MASEQVDAEELLTLGRAARRRVEAGADWRRVLIFRAISALLLGLHTTVGLVALTRPELAGIGLLWLIVAGLGCWTTATTAHLRSQRVVVGTDNKWWWVSVLPFATVAVAFLFTGTAPPIWAIILCGFVCVSLEVPRILRAARRKTLAPPTTRAHAGAPHERKAITDWSLWFITLSVGVLCAVSATAMVAVWALPFALVLPFFGWRGGRWPLSVFIGLAVSITAIYTAAMLRGYFPGYSLAISVPLGVFAAAAVAIPTLMGHHR